MLREIGVHQLGYYSSSNLGYNLNLGRDLLISITLPSNIQSDQCYFRQHIDERELASNIRESRIRAFSETRDWYLLYITTLIPK